MNMSFPGEKRWKNILDGRNLTFRDSFRVMKILFIGDGEQS